MSERSGSKPVYSIGAVSRMTRISVPTIRNWEERYAVVVPGRSAGGQRLYSRDQVEQLQYIAAQLEAGLTPAEAHRLLEEAATATSEDRAGADAPRRSLVILLAERDPYAAEFAEFFLRTEGYKVALAFDPSDAYGRFDAVPPDLVVIEWLIAGGAGGQVVRELRARADVPILVVSALAVGEAALEAGADAFLQKPLDALLFVSTVKDLLGDSAYIQPKTTAARAAAEAG